MWAKIMQLWGLIVPYLAGADWGKVIAAFEKAFKDWTGGNTGAVIQDLVDALKALFPNLPLPIQDAMDHIATT